MVIALSNNKKIPVIAVVGPTASGKTALGISLAKRLNGEVVSADSMQIYKELSIATAKPTKDEMQQINHHMIDFLSVTDDFSVAEYVKLASEKIEQIYSNGKVPIIVGGTGLYVDSLLGGVDFDAQPNDGAIRNRLSAEYDEQGADFVWQKLFNVDESAAKNIHKNNKKRLIRSLELYEITHETEQERNEKSKVNASIFDAIYICINCKDRQNLYDRINRRVDEMIEKGLLDEVNNYYEIDGTKTASQAIGCKELKPFLDGECSLEECVDALKRSTRRYAKRQLTWFLRNDSLNLFFSDEMSISEIENKAYEICYDFLKKGEKMNEA